MYKILPILSGFLLLCGTLSAQQSGQLYNTGKLYVSPQTLMTSESDFINDETGRYKNDGEVLLKGNFTNNGETGFKQNGGLTRFEGKQIQKINGSREAAFYNIFFGNNSAQYAYFLSDTMDVFGTADFTKGIVDNKNYDGLMIFEQGANHKNTSDKSYVEGIVEKRGKEDFVYPIGKKGYFRPAATIVGSNDTTGFGGEFRWENSDSIHSHALKEDKIAWIDNQEYWKIKNKTDNKDDIFVALTWRDVTTPDSILRVAEQDDDRYRVVVVRWDEDRELWVNEGGTKNLGDKTVTSDKVSGFGLFTFALLRRESKENPVANDDNSIDNKPGTSVSIVVTNNDEPGSGAVLDSSTVRLVPSIGHCIDADCKEVQVPQEGTWKVDGSGKVTFTPAEHFFKDPTPIGYTVEDKGGRISNKATITITYYAKNFFIPNAFTPNGDGHNDVWKVYGQNIKEIYIMVYNQYGQKLFENREVNVGWDGRYKGKMQPTGVYVYYAKIIFDDGREVTKKGSITLIR